MEPPGCRACGGQFSIDIELERSTVVGAGKVVAAWRERAVRGDAARALCGIDDEAGARYGRAQASIVPIFAVSETEGAARAERVAAQDPPVEFVALAVEERGGVEICLLYTSPSPRD